MTGESGLPPAANGAGWYPDVHAPGTERYYDGIVWTVHSRPVDAAEPAAPVSATMAVPGFAVGWYRDMNVPGNERYYDGAGWTTKSRPIAADGTAPSSAAGYAPYAPPIPAASARKMNPVLKWSLASAGGLVALLIVIGAFGGGIGGTRPDAQAGSTQRTETLADVPEDDVDIDVDRVVMPGVVGLSLGEAVAALEAVGLRATYPSGSAMDQIVTIQALSQGRVTPRSGPRCS